MEAERIIRAIRLYLNLTQGRIVEMLGITATAYARYEKEPGHIEKKKILLRFAGFLRSYILIPKHFSRGNMC